MGLKRSFAAVAPSKGREGLARTMASGFLTSRLCLAKGKLAGHSRDRFSLWAEAVEASGMADSWAVLVRALGEERDLVFRQVWGDLLDVPEEAHLAAQEVCDMVVRQGRLRVAVRGGIDGRLADVLGILEGQATKKARTETDSYGKMRRLLKNATETLE